MLTNPIPRSAKPKTRPENQRMRAELHTILRVHTGKPLSGNFQQMYASRVVLRVLSVFAGLGNINAVLRPALVDRRGRSA